MGVTTLRWTVRSYNESEQKIYRSKEPFDVSNLPPVYATVDAGVEEFKDTNVEPDTVYYYRISSIRNSPLLEEVGELVTVDTSFSLGPGPATPLFGGSIYGFFGEVPAEDLVTGDNLASLIKLTVGTSQNSGVPWLKFVLDGKVLYVPKMTLRHSISWDQINAVNAVYGNRLVEIQGYQFKVRLLTGADEDPYDGSSGVYYQEGTHNSEFSRLFYPLVTDDSYVNNDYTGPKYPIYTQAELNIGSGNGTVTWCQETSSSNTTYRVSRGTYGTSNLNTAISSTATAYFGWRPVLELAT